MSAKVDIGFTYLGRIEYEGLNVGDSPSDAFIDRMANRLEDDEEELLIPAKRDPEIVKVGFFQRRDIVCASEQCYFATLDRFINERGQKVKKGKAKKS